MKNQHKIKKVLFLLSAMILVFYPYHNLNAQGPDAFKYQAVTRSADGEPMKNQPVGFKISILKGSPSGQSVYTETHSATTNNTGLVNLSIGKGESEDNFANINWSQDDYFLKIEMDETGGSNYMFMGTSQLLSVPYAQFAKKAGSIDKVDTAQYANMANSFNILSPKFNMPCNPQNIGAMRYNQNTENPEFCNGTTWIVLGNTATAATPTVTTVAIYNITANTAMSGGTISNNGGAVIIDKGVCWNQTGNPTASNNRTSEGSTDNSFESLMTDLKPNTKYFVRAYAINTSGTGYGNELELITLPGVFTTEADALNSNTIKAAGEIDQTGIQEIKDKGIVYGTSTKPLISSSNAMSAGTGKGHFDVELTGLNSNTLYFVRSYATNSSGTAYGNELQSTTLPQVSVAGNNSSTKNTITISGEIAVGGNASVTARGFYYGVNNNPTETGASTSNGSGIGNFFSTIQNLSHNTKYFFQAYASNNGGTTVSEMDSIVTLPNVSATYTANFTTASSFTSGGVIDVGGNQQILERGIVYGTSENPTKADNFVTAENGTGTFTASINIPENNDYYYRAYAINEGGISYGPQKIANKQTLTFTYDGNQLQVLPNDLSGKYTWYNGSYSKVAANNANNGWSNTIVSRNKMGAGNYAAYACDTLNALGYDDWYLPAKNELNAMFENKAEIGDFAADFYWSSTEENEKAAWMQYFPSGSQYTEDKAETYKVRCIRKP